MHPSVKPCLILEWPARIIIAGLFLLLLSLMGYAQSVNLVVNPSFEKSIDFESKNHNLNWTRCLKNDSPDYIEFTSRGKPDFYYRKYIGGLLPFDGEAYVGIFCYRTNPLQGVDNIREFIQAPLLEPLAKDTIYQVSLFIALDPESSTAINNFNVCFTREQVFQKRERQMFEMHPQLKFRNETFDSITWVKLEGQYKAKGYESQIILGNFMNDRSIRKKRVEYQSKMMSKWNLHELEKAAYYYIDMVSVMKLSSIDSGKEQANNEVQDTRVPEMDSAQKQDAPLVEIEKVQRDSSIVLQNIFFEFDKSNLLPSSYQELDQLNAQLKSLPDLRIVIEGHTDNMGTYEYNIQLSLDRAKAVVEYLIENGLDRKRVQLEAYGYTRPLSDNRTMEGRQLNRRVAFRIIAPIDQRP